VLSFHGVLMRKAFTLIELLVVIAIIAILAAILFPVFAQAKEAAKKSADLSNMKQIGTSMSIYLADNDDIYPSAYYYNNDNNDTGGYTHWTGSIMPYVKNLQIFVSPVDAVGGLAPTNYIGNNGGFGAPGGQGPKNAVQDNQAPRLSYTANAAVMPRKRRSIDPSTVVSATAVDNTAGTILLAPLTDVVQCIGDSSGASGTAFKSHRSTNAFMNTLNDSGRYIGELPTTGGGDVGAASYYAITEALARNAFVGCKATALGTPHTFSHLAYTQPSRFNKQGNDLIGGNANYTYADTHAKNQRLSSTLNPKAFQWGTRNYGGGGGTILDVNGNPVTN